MTSIYDKKKAEDFSKELNKLLVKYGLKISLILKYTLQGIFPAMELVGIEEKEEKSKNGEAKLEEPVKEKN